MQLSFSLTENAGGVIIEGDKYTLHNIERLMTNTALDSHCCTDYGVLASLGTYFEGNGREVDWVTIVAGVSVLRTSVGYNLIKKEHALVCLLEYLIEDALKRLLPGSESDIENVLSAMRGVDDYSLKDDPITRMVYLIKLKTAENRKRYLLRILSSLSLTLFFAVRQDTKHYDNLSRADISFPPGRENPYPL